MPGEADERYRIIVDESSFDFRGVDDATLSDLLENLSDALETVQEFHVVGTSPEWSAIDCEDRLELCQFLYDHSKRSVSPDVRRRLAKLMDKCTSWDSSENVTAPVKVDSVPMDTAWSVHYALHSAAAGKSVACLGLSSSGRRNWLRVACEEATAEVYFFATAQEMPEYWRELYLREDVPEHRFFELAGFAFPALVMSSGLTFRKFDGSYGEMRDWVVKALSAINDEFATAISANMGQPYAVQAFLGHLGLNLSPESPKTRANVKAMRLRDVEHGGKTYRCEWHAKKDPHRNRIHFSLPAPTLGGRILIGTFIDHLPT
ncbi:hypothetical protein ACFYPK_01015 [Streptomyces halstedii]|uniref:hypothetical protein n=1 Tax=Streptomyces halstedii TaxID=1944 RepID=UPI00345F9F64